MLVSSPFRLMSPDAPGAHGEYRPHLVAHVAGGHIQQTELRERRGNRDRRHAAQFPEQLAVQIVGAHAARAGRDDFGALAVLPYERRGPVAAFVARHAPDLFAGLRVQRFQERLLVVVVDDVETTLVQHGRRRRAPAVAHAKRTQRLRPEQLAVAVEAEDANAAEVGVDALAIGHRRFRSVAVLQMTGRAHCRDAPRAPRRACRSSSRRSRPSSDARRAAPLRGCRRSRGLSWAALRVARRLRR